MINRILIRIKVVQMLYSYLLTRSEFKIDEAPESASRDRRYAYQVYTDLLLILIELSGYSARNTGSRPMLRLDKRLEGNKVAKALFANDSIKSIILRGNSGIEAFDGVLQKILDKIVVSKVYTDYAKKTKRELADDVVLWTTLFETLFKNDPEIIAAFREAGEFTNQGFLWGIRDVCMTLRSYADSREFFLKAKSDLAKSLDKAYELYLSLFLLIVDITDEQERRIESAKSKYLATSEDRNPNTKLIDNKFVAYLRDLESLSDLLDEYKVARRDIGDATVKTLLDQILASDIYAQYIETQETDLKQDTEFWRDVMRSIVLPSDALSEDLEEKSVYWNDDLQTMGTFMLKTMRQIAQSEGKKVEMLPKYKDLEDEKFGPDLFMYSVRNQEEYRKYIDMFIKRSNWDSERLAYMDIVIMTTAIAEIINFPSIPVPVSVNEYVEIANSYSTEKSGGFINGILYSIIKHLNAEGIINK